MHIVEVQNENKVQNFTWFFTLGGELVNKLMMEVSKPTSYSHLVSCFFGILISFVAYNDDKSKRFSVVSPLQLEFDVVVHYYKF